MNVVGTISLLPPKCGACAQSVLTICMVIRSVIMFLLASSAPNAAGQERDLNTFSRF